MPVPRQITQAAEDAEALRKSLYEPAPADDDLAGTQDKQDDAKSAEGKAANANNQPLQYDPLKNEPEPGEIQPQDKDTLYWKSRFEIIQGKYNAEVPTLHQRIRELEQQLAQQVDSLSADTAAGRVAQQLENELTDDELELIGPDLAGVIRKMVSGRQQSGDNAELEKVKQDLEMLKQEQQQDIQAQFWADLNATVPDWQATQANPAAQQWLATVDPMAGKSRDALLKDAASGLDSYRVINIFRELKNHIQSGGQQQNQIPAHKVQPAASRTTGAPKQEKIWTRQEINDFYRDKMKGVYKPEQAEALEKDLIAAVNEGRIS